jgi:hypothetical protein
MKRILLILVIAVYCVAASARPVSPAEALKLAKNFFTERLQQSPWVKINDVDLHLYKAVQSNGENLYYIFNNSQGGFIMVSAEDLAYPVLGFSFEGTISDVNQPESFKYWMRNYAAQIEHISAQKAPADEATIMAWKRYLGDDFQTRSVEDTRDIAPLLNNTWDQDNHYNGMCPVDAAGPGGRVYAGCVATAMGMVMYYYRYPVTGQGSSSYNSGAYGTLSANYGTTTYKWDNMLDDVSSQNDAVAQLLYHCGVSVRMSYAPDGSGAQTSDAATSMKNYFKYSTSTQYINKYSYTDANWKTTLKNNLDVKKPIIYSGHDPDDGSGHAFVCDGYQATDHFHFNWGWSGYYNGYYYLSPLNPGAYDFTSYQAAVVNIAPATGYPYFCSGQKSITGTTGTFEDGSGPNAEYQNNSDCSWLIAPTGIATIRLTFTMMDTESGADLIRVYDGSTTSAPLLGTYSGTTLPAALNSTGDKMLITFTSNGSGTGAGFFAKYQSFMPVFCSGTTTLTDETGSFSDGSGTSSYNNLSNCKWQIQPANATSITLTFTQFNTEPTYDNVKVYDNGGATSVLLGNFSGSSIPAPVTSSTGRMLVSFLTNNSTSGAGWAATYTATISGVEEHAMAGLRVYPNPANEMLNISLPSTKGTTEVRLLNSLGQLLETYSVGSGQSNLLITTMHLTEGVYFLRTPDGSTARFTIVH